MRKVVFGYASPEMDLEPLLIEMCGRIGAALQHRRRKGTCSVMARIILHGNHPQAELCPEPLPESPWISVKERLPEKDKRVLIVDAGVVSVGQYEPARYHPTGWWDCLNTDQDGCETECRNVTHWMPIPEPPKGRLCLGCGMPSEHLIQVTDKPDHHDGEYCEKCCSENGWT